MQKHKFEFVLKTLSRVLQTQWLKVIVLSPPIYLQTGKTENSKLTRFLLEVMKVNS